MNKPSILAKNITNLTDARYFAAMGVDYIAFNLAEDAARGVDIDFVKKVKEWLEGPKIVAHVKGKESINEMTKMVVEGELDALYFEQLPSNEILDAFPELTLFVEIQGKFDHNDPFSQKIIPVVNLPELKMQAGDASEEEYPSPYFVQGDFDEDFFKSGKFRSLPGLILEGGEEEKVGVKSFEDLDLIFDYFMEP